MYYIIIYFKFSGKFGRYEQCLFRQFSLSVLQIDANSLKHSDTLLLIEYLITG